LAKGFKVVAVEASPLLVDLATVRFRDEIGKGLTIEAVGLAETAGSATFYRNITNDHWSSFDRAWGTRLETEYEQLSVPCITPRELFERHGIPYYLKIDIEGHDHLVIDALREFADRPKYVSIEEHETRYFHVLSGLGYRRFKLVDQSRMHEVRCPNPPLEGEYYDARFDGLTSSGPFGEEAPGRWLTLEEALRQYHREIRTADDGWVGRPGSWWDIHATI
jgi:FkbM family methyltransferase